MKKFLKLIDGWKSVIGYGLMSIPGIGTYPMLVDAVNQLLADPNKQNVINAVVQGVLALGIAHKVIKNLNPS